MNNNAIENSRPSEQAVYDRVLKATSLLYLKDALLNQRYEDCAELIRAAKSFGAQPVEISRIIAEVTGPNAGGNGADRNKVGRRRF